MYFIIAEVYFISYVILYESYIWMIIKFTVKWPHLDDRQIYSQVETWDTATWEFLGHLFLLLCMDYAVDDLIQVWSNFTIRAKFKTVDLEFQSQASQHTESQWFIYKWHSWFICDIPQTSSPLDLTMQSGLRLPYARCGHDQGPIRERSGHFIRDVINDMFTLHTLRTRSECDQGARFQFRPFSTHPFTLHVLRVRCHISWYRYLIRVRVHRNMYRKSRTLIAPWSDPDRIRNICSLNVALGWVFWSIFVWQITNVSIVCSTVCSCADQRKHQSSASLVSVKRIHR